MIENEDSKNAQDELIDDSQTIDEEVEETQTNQVDDDTTAEGETPEEKIVKLEETNKKLFARAKKAETELKVSKKESSDVSKPAPKEDDLIKVVDQRVREQLEEKELDSIDLSDETKKSLKAYSKAEGLTIKKATESKYFSFLKQEEEAAKKVEEASIGGKRGAPTRKEFSLSNPPKYDMSTEEGRQSWKEYTDWRKSQ